MRFEKRKIAGKLPENCRKKNANFKKRKWTDPFFKFQFFLNLRFFSGNFPAIFRQFSVFQKRNPFFVIYFFLKKRTKNGKKTEILKNGNGRIRFFTFHTNFYSVFFPVFFRHFLKNPEKCRKKMVLFFSGNLRFVSVFGSKTELKPDKIRKIPMRIKTGTATCGFFQNNFVFLEKKLKKRTKTGIRF